MILKKLVALGHVVGSQFKIPLSILCVLCVSVVKACCASTHD